MDIFKLVGSIFVDSEQADRSLAKTDEKAGNVAQTLYKGIETAGKWGAAIAGGTAAAGAAVNFAVRRIWASPGRGKPLQSGGYQMKHKHQKSGFNGATGTPTLRRSPWNRE